MLLGGKQQDSQHKPSRSAPDSTSAQFHHPQGRQKHLDEEALGDTGSATEGRPDVEGAGSYRLNDRCALPIRPAQNIMVKDIP